MKNDSVDQAESAGIKILVEFHGSSILEFWSEFSKCVGYNKMRGRVLIKIRRTTTLVNWVILKIVKRGFYLILIKPTQF